MKLFLDEAFFDLFRTFEHSAFHLEVEDTYTTPDEAGPFRRFLNGEPDDFEWHKPWLDLVRGATRAGKTITRVRIITVPHVDYTRWGLTVAPLNIDAGEEIRWLPRHKVDWKRITADDFWLIDNSRVIFTLFEPDGRFRGGAETTDPVIVGRCIGVRDYTWQIATPHHSYVAN